MTPIIAAPIRAPSRLPTPPVAVKEVYRDSIRLRGDRAFQDFVLHNEIGALRCPIVNAYLRAGLILDHLVAFLAPSFTWSNHGCTTLGTITNSYSAFLSAFDSPSAAGMQPSVTAATAKPKQDLECMYFVLVRICWLGLKSGVTALFRCGSERFQEESH